LLLSDLEPVVGLLLATDIAERECGIMIRACASLVICMCDAALYIHIGKCLYNSAYTLEKTSKELNMYGSVFFLRQYITKW
jgi:hypothetical protein